MKFLKPRRQGLSVGDVMEIPYKANHGVPGKDQSYWIDSTPDTDYPQLKEAVHVDVAVLGGGIAGSQRHCF